MIGLTLNRYTGYTDHGLVLMLKPSVLMRNSTQDSTEKLLWKRTQA
jgi:hypothetical protein